MKQISQNIRRLRKEKGMSQEQLAQALHVTRQTVSAWERGIAQPGLDVLGQIAQLLGVSRSGCFTARTAAGGGSTAACLSGRYWA